MKIVLLLYIILISGFAAANCPGMFNCGNKCIRFDQVCDGRDDCPGRQDENWDTCGGGTTTNTWNNNNNNDYATTTPFYNFGFNQPPRCSLEQFACSNGRCIKRSWRCDGRRDCDDGGDEQDCPSRPQGNFPQNWNTNNNWNSGCETNQFRCDNGQCISRNFVCDNIHDCNDNSDESSQRCQFSTNTGAYNENRGSLQISQFREVNKIAQDLDIAISCDSSDDINRYVTVTWRKVNEGSLGSNVRQEGHGLYIGPAQPSNAGTYECIIEYNGQRATRRTNIIVTPTIGIKHLDANYNVRQNQDFSLTCESDEGFDVAVTWRKKNEASLGWNVRQNGAVLQISNAQPMNNGEYECTIEWNRKLATTSTHINVQWNNNY